MKNKTKTLIISILAVVILVLFFASLGPYRTNEFLPILLVVFILAIVLGLIIRKIKSR